MRHLSPVESPRAAASPTAAAAQAAEVAAAVAAVAGADNVDRGDRIDRFDGSDVARQVAGVRPPVTEAGHAPPLPDVNGDRAPDADALRALRGTQWVPSFAWAQAMDLLFELGVATSEQFRSLRGLNYTAGQQARLEGCNAMLDKVKGERRAAGLHLLTQGVALGMAGAVGVVGFMGSNGVSGYLAQSMGSHYIKFCETAANCLEKNGGPGTYAAQQADLRRASWDVIEKSTEKTERSCEETLQQSQRTLSALTDMLLQVEQKRGQVVSQINNNV